MKLKEECCKPSKILQTLESEGIEISQVGIKPDAINSITMVKEKRSNRHFEFY